MISKMVSLSLDDFSSNVSNSVRNLVNDRDFTDVTLVSENNEQIKAHKVILSSSSTFFKRILTMNYHQHPLIYLRGVNHDQLQQIIKLIYLGEVEIGESEVESFINVGTELEIDGLVDIDSPSMEKTDIIPTENVSTNMEVESLEEEKIDIGLDEVFSFESDDSIDETNDSAPPKKKIKKENIEPKEEKWLDVKKEKKCEDCDYVSVLNSSLKKHKRSKHEGIKHQCESCEKSYTDGSALLRHKKAVHDGVVYKCDTCDKVFSEGGSLTRHKKNIHTSTNC